MNPDAQVFRDYCKRCNRAEQQTEREGMNQMVQRWKMSPNQSMVTEPDGGYVEYEDHLAAIAEKNREIERLKATTIDVWVQEEDAKIKQLVRLCLSNGIISRGLACEHLGCAREDLDDVIKEDSDG